MQETMNRIRFNLFSISACSKKKSGKSHSEDGGKIGNGNVWCLVGKYCTLKCITTWHYQQRGPQLISSALLNTVMEVFKRQMKETRWQPNLLFFKVLRVVS